MSASRQATRTAGDARSAPSPAPEGDGTAPNGFAVLSESQFLRLAETVSRETGIRLPPAKRTMMQARLQRRLRALGMRSFDAYCDFVLGRQRPDDEWVRLLDAVTTNKTDFFREPAHFEHLRQVVLPAFLRRGGSQPPTFRVWSGACSTGEEIYTLAMVLEEFAGSHPGFEYALLGTDLSSAVLSVAREAIYRSERAADIPAHHRRAFVMESRDPSRGLVRIAPELRRRTSFARVNLMDDRWDLGAAHDVVFLRNVLMYFDRPTQAAVLRGVRRQLRGDGFLYVGHSETLSGLDVGLRQAAPAVYRPGP